MWIPARSNTSLFCNENKHHFHFFSGIWSFVFNSLTLNKRSNPKFLSEIWNLKIRTEFYVLLSFTQTFKNLNLTFITPVGSLKRPKHRQTLIYSTTTFNTVQLKFKLSPRVPAQLGLLDSSSQEVPMIHTRASGRARWPADEDKHGKKMGQIHHIRVDGSLIS